MPCPETKNFGRMRIGIDAKWYFTGPVSTRVVLQNLLPELFALYPEHDWIVFLDKKDKSLGFPIQTGNVKLQYIWAGNNMLSNVFLLSRKLNRLNLDVMLFQTFPSLRRKVPAISFIHDVLFRDFPQFFTWKERLYFLPLPWLTRNRSDRLIATTNFVSEDLLKYHYTRNKSKIDLVPLGVRNNFKPLEYQNRDLLLRVKEKYKLPDRFLLYVGRLNVRKNIEALLKAIPLLKDTRISLVIIGKEDWKAPDLARLLFLPAIRKRVILTGAMTDEELMATYALAEIFCFPSFAEGFGLPPLEAMASGVPALVSGSTALPEVCGNAAVYINPAEPASIASAADALLTDPDLYRRQQERGLERAKEFTWTRSAHAVMESINNASKKQIL